MNATLHYEIRKPANIQSGKQYPALFLIHGMGSNEQDLLPLTHGLEESCFVFSIRGPIDQPPGYAFFTIEGFGKPHRSSFDEAISKLIQFIDYTCEEYPIESDKLYLMGFSQGAILSMSLGLVLGDKRVKGIAALSGYIPEIVKKDYDKKPVGEISIFISHGEQDPALPFTWAPESVRVYSEMGANVTFRKYQAGHTVTQENYQDLRKWFQEYTEIGN
ncbi:esterase [Oceanobacillus piezotolerans]|uniref:Esterase n=1 Tax=Oceanobacillus piezotolerans TaxID=2448030 RepID=A0A498DEY3_9BACI|nr:dienelactone hydrolase family protein [Oceanobacillus piezotolerans]RLL47768.1 esterase [Oceanobacillus piezotolerans]